MKLIFRVNIILTNSLVLFSQFATGSYTVNMPKNAVTSLELRELIVKLRNEDKHSIGDIANIVKKSKSVIHGILKKFDETGSCEAKKPPGRPRKSTSREDRFITLQAKKERFTTAAHIAKKIKDIFRCQCFETYSFTKTK